MKHILLLFLAWAGVSALSAQNTIRIEPLAVEKSFEVDLSQPQLLQDIYVDVINETDSTIQLGWTRYEIDKPLAWETQVCDVNECYFPIVNSNIDTLLDIDAPVIIPAGDTSRVALYITPYETAGTGMFAMDFFLVERPDSLIGMATFDVQINDLVVSTRDLLKNRIYQLYPNPTSDFFQLTEAADVDRIVVMNLLGRQVGRYRSFAGGRYDVSRLPDGIYLVSLVNDELGIIRTLRMSKRGLRP
jgi:hypothetical protein